MKRKNCIDRTKLHKIHFVLPLKGQKHAQVPIQFLEEVGNADAMLVYLTLRSGLPTHHWNTTTVYLKLIERGAEIGRTRVEKAMKFLNVEGWIRYVELIKSSGEANGTIAEVQGTQLPENLRGVRGRIKERADGSLSPMVLIPPSTLPKSLDKNGGQTARAKEKTPKHDQPHHRSPVERSSEDKYNKIEITEEEIEESPTLSGEREHEVPLGEGLGPCGPLRSPDTVPTSPGGTNTATKDGEEVSEFVGEADEARLLVIASVEKNMVDYDALCRTARLTKKDPNLIPEFEILVQHHVFPILKDPPAKDRRKATEALEWCETSAKGRFLLWLSVDENWTPDLARRFVKSPSRWALAHLKRMLLTGVFANSRKVPLADLIIRPPKHRFGEDEPETPETLWQTMAKQANQFHDYRTRNLETAVGEFKLCFSADEAKKHMEWKLEELRREPSTFNIEPGNDYAIFYFFFYILLRTEERKRPFGSEPWERESFVELQDEHRSAVLRYASRNWMAYTFAKQALQNDRSRRFLGIGLAELELERNWWATQLEQKASRYGLSDVPLRGNCPIVRVRDEFHLILPQ